MAHKVGTTFSPRFFAARVASASVKDQDLFFSFSLVIFLFRNVPSLRRRNNDFRNPAGLVVS
jgi:hypothetical protein